MEGMRMQRYSVIDLGSNTVRLVTYDVKTDKDAHDKSELFQEIVNEKKTAGLAAYVIDGLFTEEGVEQACETVEHLLHIAKNIESHKTRIFATAVLRNCSNSKEVVREIEDRIGKSIDILSEEDEAHLGFVGAACTGDLKEGTLIDIGGGSTELTAVHKGHDSHNVSLGQGCVSSYSEFVKMILPTHHELEEIERAFEGYLFMLDEDDAYRAETVYGIGGSVRAVAKMCGLVYASKSKLKTVSLEQIDGLFELLKTDPSTFAHHAVKAAPDRLHSLMPGCTILRSCMRTFGATALKVCKYGVREGYLLERMLKV